MEQEQAGVEFIRSYISERFPMYTENPAFETWLFGRTGTSVEKLDDYLNLLYGYGYLQGDGTVIEGYEAMPVPSEVKADIERRLAALGGDTVAVLRRASVEGALFGTRLLKVIDGDATDVDRHLAAAAAAGVIASDPNPAELPVLGHRYRFVPLQIRDVLYQELSESERAGYHTALVEYLSGQLDHARETGERDMLAALISEHNKRFTRPDPPPAGE